MNELYQRIGDYYATRKIDSRSVDSGFVYAVARSLSNILGQEPIRSAIDIGGFTGANLNEIGDIFNIERRVCLDLYEPDSKIKGVEYVKGDVLDPPTNLHGKF